MIRLPHNSIHLLITGCFLFLQSCKSSAPIHPKDPAFVVLDQKTTGLAFSNTLHPAPGFNVLDYMYFYNGAGIGAGDFNNDGLIDLFFAANQENNRLFLNTGNLHFKDVTSLASLPQDKGWSTGVSVIDINNDGLLDIYICKVGRLGGLPVSKNQLLVCQGIDRNGIPSYKDKAAEYGLDFSGFGTQAVFFDYDGDGDLDMYLLNHSIHQNGTYGPRKEKLAIVSPYSGDRLFRNDGHGRFTECTKEAGIHGSVLGYGLGVAVSDIDLDGWPDIYTGNDLHENDYLYINDHHGHFTDQLTRRILHTSRFSMGVDIADVNNDALPEIISMDMLPFDPYILKRSEGEESWDSYHIKLDFGYNYQYTRNNLQFNRGNGHFSETGLYSGVAATDWSWAPLWMDFDNDGKKDLFISNGIPRRLNDLDFINFVSNQELEQTINNKSMDDKEIDGLSKFPQIRLPSKFFHNEGDMKFADMEAQIDGATPNFSNGAIYADLDNDGDLDVVVNNIDAPALIYKNTSNDKKNRPSVSISLKGSEKNRNAIGARIIVFSKAQVRTYEKYPVRGFLSSMETPLSIGLFQTRVDSAFLVWPDNSFQPLALAGGETPISVTWQKGLPAFHYSLLDHSNKDSLPAFTDITASTGLLYRHEENDFHEFDREPLIPHMLSTEGPALAVGDVNKDGLDDVFIGSSSLKTSAIFIQQPSGSFLRTSQPDLDADSTYEDIDACWTDVNNDGNMDLVVANGGNEFFGQDPILTPRVYLGDGRAHFRRLSHPFANLFVNASCIKAFDFNGDGSTDLFIGGRSMPYNYGQTPPSFLLLNDGKGNFTDVTEKYAPGLSRIGFVTSAQWSDLDKDGHKDLLIGQEWGGILAFMYYQGHYVQKSLSDKKGWWNFILPIDIDNDGDIDIIAGNLGLNSRLTASEKDPVRLYVNDFDNNGKKEQILTYILKGKEIPFATKQELERQLPILKKRFLYAEDFAKASVKDLLSADLLGKADTLSANYFANAILVNQGNGYFQTLALPWQAQFSPYRDAVVFDANGDHLPDVLLFGNFYDNNIQMGRYDADYGTLLLNKGNDSFSTAPINGLAIQGQVRHVSNISIKGKPAFVLARNDDSIMVIRCGRQAP